MRKFVLLLLLVVAIPQILALNNGLGLTPPMGFLVWERFKCDIDCQNDPTTCISEQLFTSIADAMVAGGFKDAGYEYVNIDDCWSAKERDSQGRLQADPTRFPHGIAWLAKYMHDRGLKLGLYADFGNYTCEHYPGSQYYMKIDAQTFASWGIDSLKVDGCNTHVEDMNAGYPAFGQYLNKTGRPILYSCSWPDYMRLDGLAINWTLIAETCNLWRLFDDISDSWPSVSSIISYWYEQQQILTPNAHPGSWNDPDMLIIGDFGLSYEEAKTQMALWSMWSAPLLMSNDPRNITNQMRSILINKEVIRVNQDSYGIQATTVGQINTNSTVSQVWYKPLSDGGVAVTLYNPRDSTRSVPISFNFADVGWHHTAAHIRDLFLHKDLGVYNSLFGAKVSPHHVIMLKLTKVK